MIDFNKLTEKELSRVGIAFETVEEAMLFSAFVTEELEVKIGESISTGISESLLQEFDSITDEKESVKWLEKNRPDYREVVKREQYQMVWTMLCLREKISTASSVPEPKGIEADLSDIGLSPYTLRYFKTHNLNTVKEVIKLSTFDDHPGLFKYYQTDTIVKIVDYILSDKGKKKRHRLHPLIDYFED